MLHFLLDDMSDGRSLYPFSTAVGQDDLCSFDFGVQIMAARRIPRAFMQRVEVVERI